MTTTDGRGGALRALRVRNFRLFFVGQTLSVTGTWVHNTAIAWIVVRQEHAAAGVGLVVAMGFLPLLVLGAWAGLLADRGDKRRILVTVNSAAAMIALATAVIVGSGHRSLPVLAGMALLMGVTAAFEMPVRESLVGQLVEADDLPSAIGLNGAIMTSSRMAGSALAGLLIVAFGSTLCLYVNALSFLATITGILCMREEEIRAFEPLPRARGQVTEGIRFALREPAVRFVLVALAVVGTLALNNQVTTPLLARVTFHAGVGMFAAFSAAAAFGALCGALISAGRKEATVSMLAGSALAFGVMLSVVVAAPWVGLALPALAGASGAGSLYVATTNARLQALSGDRYRGRVMSLYYVLLLGSTPVGSLVVSAVAAATNPRVAIAVGAVAALGTGTVALSRSGRAARTAALRPVMLPTMADEGGV